MPLPTPPGEPTDIAARSVLVVAPHADDEVLGCGGLVARLTGSGAVARVLFLSDSGGGDDDEREERRQRRRNEAAAAARVLGLAGLDHLGLPDGRLEHHLEAMTTGLRRAVLSQRPDLLLVPSPLEVTPDHRAVFRAVHDLFAPLRADGEDPLLEAVEGLTVLLYEVNQAAYPDVLVDVTEQVPVIEEAMACHASQLAKHDYLAASLGLRRFRTLTLPGDVKAAEGYRRLTVDDFTTRSPAQLVRHLGGRPELQAVSEGPTISVVVRTKDRPALLAQALASLADGVWRRLEVVLVNDGGEPPVVPGDFPFPVRRVDLPENQGRAAAANAGVAAATGAWVTFLDDDDVAAPEHLATLAAAAQGAGVRVVYSDAAVAVYRLAGRGEEVEDGEGGDGSRAAVPGERGWVCRERRLPYSRDFDPELLLLDNYIPFNTLLIERGLFDEVVPATDAGEPFDPDLAFFEDWDFLIRLSRVTKFHHLPRVTCEYRHFRGGGHHILGDEPRRRADFLAMKARVYRRHTEWLDADRLARVFDGLKGEAVEAREVAKSASAGLAAEQHQRRRWEGRYHRLHGEAVGLRQDTAAKGEELDRLYEEERRLRAAVAEQGEHLERTYAEIERLQQVIRDMEATRAWRLHRRLQGWLPGSGSSS